MRSLFLIIFALLVPLGFGGCEQKNLKPSQQIQVATIGLNAGAISDDGKYAVVGSIYHGISLWRLSDQERLFNWNHKSNINTTLIAADFSPDGKWALTADTHTLVLWNVETGDAPRYWRAPGDILSVQLSRNGTTALLGLSDNTAVLFDIQRGGILRTLTHGNRVRSVSLADSGKQALTGSEDYTAITWNLDTEEAVKKQVHQDDVQLVCISPNGELALSVSKYDKAIVWNTYTGELVGEIPLAAEKLKRGLRFTSARFSKDNAFLLTGRPDQIISLWALEGFSLAAQWKIPKKDAWKPTSASILDVAFSAQAGEYKAIASNGYIYSLAQKQK